jgi:hypothetical protein
MKSLTNLQGSERGKWADSDQYVAIQAFRRLLPCLLHKLNGGNFFHFRFLPEQFGSDKFDCGGE